MRTLLSFSIVVALCGPAIAQKQFGAESTLPLIDHDGFYRIPLSPDAVVHVNDRFSNIRIYDQDGTEVPYLLQSQSKKTELDFVEYGIEERTQLKDSCSVMVLSNPSRTSIHNISLLIRNAEVTKEATLSGSDDRVNWYALKERFLLSNIRGDEGTAELKIVDFPLSNYAYYKIWINDKTSPPLNIIRAGYYKTVTEDVDYTEIRSAKLNQTENREEKTSVVRLAFDTLRFVDKVEWQISGMPFYQREGILYAERSRIDKKGKTETYLEYLGTIQLKSGQRNELVFDGTKVKELVFKIINHDNPPLRTDAFKAYQLSRHITTWLQKGKKYTVKFGNPEMNEPVYDLAFFLGNIPAQIPDLDLSSIAVTRQEENQSVESVFARKYLIWGAIAVVVALLAFMSVRMLKEANAVGKDA